MGGHLTGKAWTKEPPPVFCVWFTPDDGYFFVKGDSRALWESADGFSWKLAAMELPHLRFENRRSIAPFCAGVDRGAGTRSNFPT